MVEDFSVAGIAILIGIVSFFPIYIHFDGQYMDYGDYFSQYIPFVKELKRLMLSGLNSWSWNSFLGDGFVGAFSYYTVFNPFAWFVALFPESQIMYATMLAILLKLALCTYGSYIYIYIHR